MSKNPFSVEKIRADFPILANSSLVFLDSAASSQKPKAVIDRISHYYSYEHANVHRGIYKLSEEATASYENVRVQVQRYLDASELEEIVFTRGTTESLNIVAHGLGKTILREGDEVILPISEHHSNIVPWQMLAKEKGIKIVWWELNDKLRLELDTLKSLITKKTKVISIAHYSNVLGVRHPVEDVCKLCKEKGIVSIIDGAQGVPHERVQVKEVGCDFYAMSAHKCLGPTGVGALYGKREWLEKIPPIMGGGDMIKEVHRDGYVENTIPHKFEAGTPGIAGVVGLGAAIGYLGELDQAAAQAHEHHLGVMAYEMLQDLDGFKPLVHVDSDWCGVVSFYHETIHAHDLAAIADSDGVCLRAGHHCAQPLMEHLGLTGTVRMSPYLYNTEEEIVKFGKSMKKALDLMA